MQEKENFYYGAVYKIERTYTRDEIEKNLAMMKQNGMNTVVIWPSVYWWEPKTENYPFDTGLFILKTAEKLGLKVIMEFAGQITCMEYAPDFDFDDEFYCVNEDGSLRNKSNGYDPLNYNNPRVKARIKNLLECTAAAYKDQPALYGWDIWNEAIFKSYDEYTLELFKEWLKNVYGDISALNNSWERNYKSFDGVRFEHWMWASIKPVTDYYEFSKANVGMILNEWKGYLKAVDAEHPVIADNIGSMVNADWAFDRPQDDREVSRNADEYGISFYPKQSEKDEYNYADRHITLAAARAAAGGSFWISEMQGHIQALFRPGTCVKPYELRRWCYEALAHGAKGIIYWKWDPFFKGMQTYGRGLVDSEGRPTERLLAAARVMKDIKQIEREILSSNSAKAKAAVLFDGDNHNYIKALGKNYGIPPVYTDGVCGAFTALLEAGIQADIVYPESDFTGYRLIIVNNQILLNDEFGQKLKDYMTSGGTVVFSGMSGIMDDSSVMFKRLPGGKHNCLYGCRQIDTEYSDGFTVNYCGARLSGSGYRNIVALDDNKIKRDDKAPGCSVRSDGVAAVIKDAECTACSRSEKDGGIAERPFRAASFSDGRPAIVESPCGKGRGIFFTFDVFSGSKTAETLAEILDKRLNLKLLKVHGRVKAHLSLGKDTGLIYVFNYSAEQQEYEIEYNDFKFFGSIAENGSAVLKFNI